MKTAIWKYTIEATPGKYPLTVPSSFQILSIQPQHNKIAIWGSVNLDTPHKERTRTLKVIETGTHFISEPFWIYHTTCIFDNNNYVLHVFEI